MMPRKIGGPISQRYGALIVPCYLPFAVMNKRRFHSGISVVNFFKQEMRMKKESQNVRVAKRVDVGRS